jgi:hypothetical protein
VILSTFFFAKKKKVAKKKLATLRLDRCRVWEHIEQIPLSRLRESMLFAEALGNPRNYPLDERVFAAFGYLSDSVRVGALRFARWCAYRTASPPIGLLLSHQAL